MAEEPLETFLQFVREIAADGDQEQFISKLKQRWEHPPTALVASVLERTYDDAQVRQLLFYPTAEHMAIYARLLTGDAELPAGDLSCPANKIQAVALGHLWLVHGRRWQCLKPFILAGGLKQLVALLSAPQPVMASQALELLILSTHPSMYDWNPQPPEAQQAGGGIVHPAAGSDAALWAELAQLQSGPLLGALLRLSPDAWPGSGYVALQFLTWYLNWLRDWYCKDGVLQLSAALLSGLSAWSSRAAASPDERQLAAQLAADFGRHGPAPPTASGGRVGPAAAEEDVAVSCGGAEPQHRVVADRTAVNSQPGSEAERLKAAGNDAFKARDWGTAIQLYSAALDVPVPHSALLDEGPRRATYHSNRAAAYLERYKELQAAAADAADTASGDTQCDSSSSSGTCCQREVGGVLDGLVLDGSNPEARAKLLQAAVLDCRAALQLVPTHAKAHYRLATALRAQGSLELAQAAARSAEQHATCKAEAASAAQLAAAIAKQLQQPKQPQALAARSNSLLAAADVSKQPGATMPGAAARAQSVLSTGPQPSRNLKNGADAVDQLLEQFARAITQQGGPSQQQGGSARAGKGSTAGRLPEVLLPSQAAALKQQQQQQDEQGLVDQLVLPGHSTSKAGSASQPRSRPLIQEL